MSELRFEVPAGCSSFSALVGVDDEVGSRGSVVFEVWNGTTSKLFSSDVRRGGQPALLLSGSVAGVSELRLVVTDAGDGKAWDHADWIAPVLRCAPA
jgi:hypothetical protein